MAGINESHSEFSTIGNMRSNSMPEPIGFEVGAAGLIDDYMPRDYQDHLIMLERQNKKRLVMARKKKDDVGQGESGTPPAETSMEEDSSQNEVQWPEDCRYFDPYSMDARFLRSLLWEDSSYLIDESAAAVEGRLDCVGLAEKGYCVDRRPLCNPSPDELSQWLSDDSLTTRIVYVGLKRRYYYRKTQNAISLTCEQWMQLLCSLEILPAALEVLHDNNGGLSSHVTYRYVHDSSRMATNDDSICAYHVCLKLGDSWPNHENFFYARHDFADERNVMLIAGTGSRKLCSRLCERLSVVERSDIFCVLVIVLSLWLNQAENNRWELDYTVQDIESRTGFSSMQYRRYEPLTAEQLSLTKDMAQTAESIALLIVYMENMIKSIIFVKEQHLRYHDICQKRIKSYNPPCATSQLQDALARYHSQACSKKLQMQMLQARVAAQIAVTNTLVAHRDSSVNIEIAKDMKADSKLMRGIAFVTMIFLPATFLATFFSMTFFHLGGSDGNFSLEVSRWIWLYPLCTIPLTLVLAVQYGLDITLGKLKQAASTKLRSRIAGQKADKEAQTHDADGQDQAAMEEWVTLQAVRNASKS